ncbi:hypothetical protein IV102_22560 [bacterium]|nr:hypothetical protein [bacterium]
MRNSFLLIVLCLLAGCGGPKIPKAEQEKQAKTRDWEARLKATAESIYLDDLAAVTEILTLSQQKVQDLKEDTYIAGQLQASLPLLKVSQSGGGVDLLLPVKLGSTTFSQNMADLQQHQRESLAGMLEPGLSALMKRHLVSLKTEVRLEMYSRQGFKIKEVVESGQFDMAGVEKLVQSQNIQPGQPVPKAELVKLYRKLSDNWSKFDLTRMR